MFHTTPGLSVSVAISLLFVTVTSTPVDAAPKAPRRGCSNAP